HSAALPFPTRRSSDLYLGSKLELNDTGEEWEDSCDCCDDSCNCCERSPGSDVGRAGLLVVGGVVATVVVVAFCFLSKSLSDCLLSVSCFLSDAELLSAVCLVCKTLCLYASCFCASSFIQVLDVLDFFLPDTIDEDLCVGQESELALLLSVSCVLIVGREVGVPNEVEVDCCVISSIKDADVEGCCTEQGWEQCYVVVTKGIALNVYVLVALVEFNVTSSGSEDCLHNTQGVALCGCTLEEELANQNVRLLCNAVL